MGKIRDFFNRPAKLNMVGHDLHIQPTTKKLQQRSMARVRRLQMVVANGAPESYKKELDRRVKELKEQGIKVSPYKGV